jgi:hypothetical protein
VVEPNLVWKDTVLVRTGETVDILLDVTNPGRSMAPCPHRRAPREWDDVQLQRPSGSRSQRGVEVSVINGLIDQVIGRHPTIGSERRNTPKAS